MEPAGNATRDEVPRDEAPSEKAPSAYCPGCDREVHLTLSRAPSHRGHANLPDGAEMVCLDFSEGCSGGRCPLTGSPGIVMAVRLARSHLADEKFTTLFGRCDACGNVTELEILDDRYAFCPICESTTQWIRMNVDPEGTVVVTVK